VKNSGSGLHNITEHRRHLESRASFLYLIAALNVVILVSIVKRLPGAAAGQVRRRRARRASCNQRGLMNRFFGPLARRIDTPWKMYPIGVLFGLGFDTATEVALLVLSGTAVASGLPFYAILSLPILFAAGMCTVRHVGRVLHELRLRVGVRPADPEGVLQHHDHRALGGGGVLDRDSIELLGPAPLGVEPGAGELLEPSWRTSTSTPPGS
jgi:hypothetical protein